jgi:hypothetical protein
MNHRASGSGFRAHHVPKGKWNMFHIVALEVTARFRIVTVSSGV